MDSRTMLADLPTSIYGMDLAIGPSASADIGQSELAIRLRPVPEVCPDSRSWYRSPERDEHGVPHSEVRVTGETSTRPAGGTSYWIAYSDGPRFVVDRAGREVVVDSGWCNRDPDLVRAYLLGPVISFVLRLRGTLALHAGVVDIGGRALALCGKQGAGKSTTTAALINRNAGLVSEDVAALVQTTDGFEVAYGPDSVRLWPASIDALYGQAAVPSTPLHPTAEKRLVQLRPDGSAGELSPLPLAAVYVLAERRPTITAPRIESIDARAAMLSLLPHTRQNQWLTPELRRTELAALGRLIASTPVQRIAVPYDLLRLDELCLAIEENFEALTAVASGSGAG